MKIETKFDIGQTVYVISGDKVIKKEIDTIMKYLDRPVQYQFTDYDFWWDEESFFATKKEAQAKLKELKGGNK